MKYLSITGFFGFTFIEYKNQDLLFTYKVENSFVMFLRII